MNRTDGKLSIPAQQHSERLTTSNSERARAGSRAVQMHVIVARDRAWTCFGPGTDHNADGLVSLGGTDQECYYVPQLLDQPSDLSTSRRRKGFIARAQTLRPQRIRGNTQRHALDLHTFRAHTWADHSPRRDLSPSSRSGTRGSLGHLDTTVPYKLFKAAASVNYITPN